MNRETMAIALCLVAALMVFGHCVGCEPPASAREAAAESAYGAELQRCVQKYETEREIDACADGVRMRWGIDTTTTRDAGGQ